MEFAALLAEANRLGPELVELRRDLHRHPELGFQENRTAQRLVAELDALGLEVRSGVGRTGVVAVLRGAMIGPSVGIRACMDALPIPERSGAPYASELEGVSHACGHEAQCAWLVGAARLLAPLRSSLAGQIVFIFQPAEEIDLGARAMLDDGLLETTPLDIVFGVHAHVDLKVGAVGLRPGSINGSIDTVRIRVIGHAGHGALPHRAVDALLAASSILMQLQSVVARRIDPVEPAVISIGTFHAGEAPNIIADEAVLTGTIRAANPEVRARLPELIRSVATATAAAHGATCQVEFFDGLPSVVNDARVTKLLREGFAQALGADQVLEPPIRMGGDDFSLFAERVPGCYFWIGVADPTTGRCADLHTPEFDLDERSIPLGAGMVAAAALWASMGRTS